MRFALGQILNEIFRDKIERQLNLLFCIFLYAASLALSAPPHIVDYSKSPKDMIFKSSEQMIALLKHIFGNKMKIPPMFIIRALMDIKNNSSEKLIAGVSKKIFIVLYA